MSHGAVVVPHRMAVRQAGRSARSAQGSGRANVPPLHIKHATFTSGTRRLTDRMSVRRPDAGRHVAPSDPRMPLGPQPPTSPSTLPVALSTHSSWAGTAFFRQFTTRGDRLRCRPIPKARLIPSGTTKPLHGLGATSRWPPRRRSAFSRRTRPPGPPSRTLARRSPLLWRALVKRSGSAERKPPEKTALAPCHVVPELPARNVLVGGA